MRNLLVEEGGQEPMWRALCAVVLLPTFTAAQSEVAATAQAVQSQPSSAAPAGPSKPAYRSYTYYNEIRRGTTEDIAVQIAVPGLVTLPKSPVPGIVPLRLELQTAEGFTIDRIRYPKASKRKLALQPESVRVASTWNPIQFKLRVDRSAALGTHTLVGRMTFQTINGVKGVGEVQQVEVQIPVTVVDHDSKVSRGEWPIHKLPVWAVVLLIVFSPVLIALAIPFYLVCAMEGPRNCPD
jgi:hypothetical protein